MSSFNSSGTTSLSPTGEPRRSPSTPGAKLNGLWIAGLVVDTLVTLYVFTLSTLFGFVISLFLALAILGTLMCTASDSKVGRILFIIGTLAFVPIGMIGLFGMQKARDQVASDAFFKQGK